LHSDIKLLINCTGFAVIRLLWVAGALPEDIAEQGRDQFDDFVKPEFNKKKEARKLLFKAFTS
jgi:hypothetical protein